MTYNLQFEDVFTSVFETVVKSFKDKSRDIVNSILMSLIVSMKNKNDALRTSLEEMFEDETIIKNMNLDEYYDHMLSLQDNLERLVGIAKQHRDKSEMFNEFYKSVKDLYETVVYVTIEVGFMEAKSNHEVFLENAS
ncbi:MAG: hypothetical protein AB7U24_02875 [Sulfurimonadaceae bacterium]